MAASSNHESKHFEGLRSDSFNMKIKTKIAVHSDAEIFHRWMLDDWLIADSITGVRDVNSSVSHSKKR